MIYIYDILVNFNKTLIDFYDWKESDVLTHIRKIPLIKIKSEDYADVYNCKIKFDKTFLESIYNKTEIFGTDNITKNEYSIIIASTEDALVCNIGSNGVLIQKSKLILDEELDILEIIKSIEFEDINYEVIKENVNKLLLREEDEKIENILDQIKEIKDKETLNYIYFEWYGKTPKDKNYYDKLIRDINKEYNSRHDKILHILELMRPKV